LIKKAAVAAIVLAGVLMFVCGLGAMTGAVSVGLARLILVAVVILLAWGVINLLKGGRAPSRS
jgi:hypothetical protein